MARCAKTAVLLCALIAVTAWSRADAFVVNSVDMNGVMACAAAVNAEGQPVVAYGANTAMFSGLRFAVAGDPNVQRENLLATGETLSGRCDLCVNRAGETLLAYGLNDGVYVTMKSSWFDWTTVQVDTVDCRELALAVSGNDVPYMLYSEADLTLHWATYDRKTNTWISQTLWGYQGAKPSIAIDNDGVVYVCFYDTQAQCIQLLRRSATSGAWSILGSLDGRMPTMTVNAAGWPMVAFMDGTQLACATFVVGWSTTVVDDGTAGTIAMVRFGMAANDAGTVAIAYRRDNALCLAVQSTPWTTCCMADDVAPVVIDLVFDADDDPLIAFFNKVPDSSGGIKLAGLNLTPQCMADLDENGMVDLLDFEAFADGWDRWNDPPAAEDFDESGTVDIEDLNILCSYWLWQR